MTNTFIHSHSSLGNHTLFQTKMDKVYTLYPLGTANIFIAYIREHPLALFPCHRVDYKNDTQGRYSHIWARLVCAVQQGIVFEGLEP